MEAHIIPTLKINKIRKFLYKILLAKGIISLHKHLMRMYKPSSVASAEKKKVVLNHFQLRSEQIKFEEVQAMGRSGLK